MSDRPRQLAGPRDPGSVAPVPEPDEPSESDVTDATSTDPSTRGSANRTVSAGLAIVLVCDHPELGGALFSLAGLDRVVIGRDKRGTSLEKVGPREARLNLKDTKASRDHAEIRRTGAGFEVRDLGSTNGTYLDEVAIAGASLVPSARLRVGHTFLALIPDAAAAVERAAKQSAEWPFATLSSPLANDLARLERIAASALPILIAGETGTGKERVARAIHERSGRPGAFVAVNCGAIPSHLVESHLFGHKKGAFSGALSDEPGFVRTAHQGTLFLDEVGDLPLSAQASLLRVLQEGEVLPVGAAQPIKVDFRVLSATHRPLDQMVSDATFREDLLARLAAFRFELPPLRDRMEDLGVILASMCGSAATASTAPLRFDTDAAFALITHPWRRNVRELIHAIEVARMLARDGVVRVADLPLGASVPAPPLGEVEPRSSAPPRRLSAEDAALRAELARRFIERDGNVAAIARDMGKARQQVQRWKKRFGLGE